MTTIYDIAKKANVSPMTVSRVINKKGNISEETKAKVEAAIKELNYIPNSIARSLTSKKTKLLALMITDITNPFFTKIARGAADKANQMGYQLILCNTDEDVEKEAEFVDSFLSKGVDGVLITAAGDQSKKSIKKLLQNNVPFTLIDRNIEGISCDRVLGDSYQGTRMLLQYLIDKGHKKIGMINAPLNISTAKERYETYEEIMKLNNLPLREDWIAESKYQYGWENTDDYQLLYQPPAERPTAIFAANNFIAIDIILKLKKYNIHVPDEMEVVCFDALEPYSNLNTILTVAAQPAYDFGFTGAQLVIDRIEGNGPSEYRKIILQPSLIEKRNAPEV